MDRRTFLRLGLGTAALATARPILGRDPAHAQPAPGPFGHGVASGDPLADRVVIWTRVTPSEDATPGSGRGPATPVAWEVATDSAFAHVVASGSVTTSPSSDHTVKVDVGGLSPFTEHWYRFRALGATSPVGRAKTAPAEDDVVESLRFGVVSCSNYEGGYFSSYRHLAGRDDLDLVLHLGDYIYETGRGSYGPGAAFGRAHDPDHEIVTLEDYRRRHALHKADADLAALHARYAFVTTIDDHEVTDNTWGLGAGNHQPEEGLYSVRKATAMQAYFEWMPIRSDGGADEPNRIYRHLSLGGLADLFVLDERGYRSQQVEGLREDMIATTPEVRDPSRTMLGHDQLAWLEDGLERSQAQWKIMANSVMFSPLVVVDLPDVPEVTALLQTVLAGVDLSLPVVINADQWDGYAAEQAHLTHLYQATGGVVVLTGDIHSSWAAEVPVDPGSYMVARSGPTAAVEFVTPAVTSNSFSESLGSIIPGGELLVPHLPLVVDVGAPWFKYLEPDSHGFGVFEITPAAVQYDWHYVSDRTDPQATERIGQSWRSVAGSNKLQVARPLGPRAAAAFLPLPTPPAPPEGGPDGGGGPAPDPNRLPATGGAVPTAVAAAAATAGALGAAAVRAAGRHQDRPAAAEGAGEPPARPPGPMVPAGFRHDRGRGTRGGRNVNRRQFLGRATAAGAMAGVAPGFWRAALSAPVQPGESPYGALQAPDANGLMLPAGFRSRVVASSLTPVPGTSHLWHMFPDGGACVPTDDGGWIYVSNSENPPPIDIPAVTGLLAELLLVLKDVPVTGGVGAIRFDRTGQVVDAYRILGGTLSNCAGGLTPWGTWLSCEEWEDVAGYDAGKVWECDPFGRRTAVARPALGVFKHEMATADPDRRHLYLSEDQPDGLLYRYTPPTGVWGSGAALEGGLLEAMAVREGAVSWIRVDGFEDPAAPTRPLRKAVRGAAHFDGGEGIVYDRGVVYLTTKGDDRVWAYDIEASTMTVIYDSSEHISPVLDGVDNLAVSKAHDLYVAEDGGNLEVCVITPDRAVFPVARMTGGQHGFETGTPIPLISEVTGLALSPDGNRLYFNSERGMGIGGLPIGPGPGILYEVTGPFRGGTLAEDTEPPTTTTTEPPPPSPAPTTPPAGADGPGRLAATGGGAALGAAGVAAAAGAALWRLRQRTEAPPPER